MGGREWTLESTKEWLPEKRRWGQILISRVESGRLLPWHDPCV